MNCCEFWLLVKPSGIPASNKVSAETENQPSISLRSFRPRLCPGAQISGIALPGAFSSTSLAEVPSKARQGPPPRPSSTSDFHPPPPAARRSVFFSGFSSVLSVACSPSPWCCQVSRLFPGCSFLRAWLSWVVQHFNFNKGALDVEKTATACLLIKISRYQLTGTDI